MERMLDTGAKIIIPPDQSLKSLEEAIDEGISEARGRWKAEGRTQNRFSHVAYELERLMEETPEMSDFGM